MSSVRSIYCGHNFSSELTLVMPTEAHTLPSPVMPCSLAPHGTASIFSIMARCACFLSPANIGSAIESANSEIANLASRTLVLFFIKASLRKLGPLPRLLTSGRALAEPTSLPVVLSIYFNFNLLLHVSSLWLLPHSYFGSEPGIFGTVVVFGAVPGVVTPV